MDFLPQRLFLNEEQDTVWGGQHGPSTGIAKCCLKVRRSIFFSLKSPRLYFQVVHRREIKSGVSQWKNVKKETEESSMEGVTWVPTLMDTGFTRPQSTHYCYT